jgi:hypothetical protein
MVLGFAALAATISQAPRRESSKRDVAAAPPPASVDPPSEVRLSARGRPRTVRLAEGDSAVLVASVNKPGQVELDGLGLLAAADPSTPATFPLRVSSGRYPVLFTPAGSEDVRRIGTVLVRR